MFVFFGVVRNRYYFHLNRSYHSNERIYSTLARYNQKAIPTHTQMIEQVTSIEELYRHSVVCAGDLFKIFLVH